MKQTKKVYKIFSIANPEKLESYLGEKAARRWHLHHLSIRTGIFTFHWGQPINCVYCLRNKRQRSIQDRAELEEEGWRILDVGHDWLILINEDGCKEKVPQDEAFRTTWFASISKVILFQALLFGFIIVMSAILAFRNIASEFSDNFSIFNAAIMFAMGLLGFVLCMSQIWNKPHFYKSVSKVNRGKTKKVYRIWPIWNEEKIDAYLRDQSAQGWQLARVGVLLSSMTFIQGQPGRFEYCVRNRKERSLDDIPALVNAGWSILYMSPIIFGWHVFQREAGGMGQYIPIDWAESSKSFRYVILFIAVPFFVVIMLLTTIYILLNFAL